MNNLQQIISTFHSLEDTQGLFLSLEGIEGSGKSTQIKFLHDFFIEQGYRVLTLREPGGTNFGEKLRQAVLESTTPLHPLAEAYLFASSRTQLLHEKILPFLAEKKSVVILDRYIDSSLAYQGQARGLGYEKILKIHESTPLNLLPHRTYFLDIDLETSIERQIKRGNEKDYFESEKKDFYLALIKGYRDMAKLFNQRTCVIDGTLTPESIFQKIIEDVKILL